VQYRSGWGFDDEYLLFETIGWTDHGNYDLGALVQYCAGGRLWIVDHGYTNVTVEHHSTLDVKRDGKPAWDNYPNFKGRFGFFRTGSQIFDITKLDPAKSGTPGAFEVVAIAPDMAGANWTRHLRGGGGAPLVVEDTLTADQPGTYEIISRLRLLGDVTGENGHWLVKQQDATLPVTLDVAADDNAAEAIVKVTDSKIKVLLISADAGHEFQYLKNYLLSQPQLHQISDWQQDADVEVNQLKFSF
jgi:hypothetical protein